jgi:hypothetical protein
MRHHLKVFSAGMVIFVISFFFHSAFAQYAIPRSVFGSGGASLSSSSNKIVGTLGQPFIGITSGASNKELAGFWYAQSYLLTDINDKSQEILPSDYQLQQNYPNPFNPSTVIEFALPEESQVSIKLYSVLGEEVATIVEVTLLPGFHKVEWRPEGLSSGIYFYSIVAKSEVSNRTFSNVKKLIYMR